MTVLRNGKPLNEEDFDKGEPERAEAMRKWHENNRPQEQGPSQFGGLNQNWRSPRSWKHNRTIRP